MERFVQSVLVGGVALVAGLWLLALFEAATTPWFVGAGLATLGSGGLVAGIGTEVTT
jgi:hypothetical protein